MKDIRLENESQVIQDVFPPLAALPPAMLGKAISGSGHFRSLRGCRCCACRLKHRALQAHEQIGTGHEFPPAFNGSIIGDAKIGPAELIFGVFQAVFDPGTQARRVLPTVFRSLPSRLVMRYQVLSGGSVLGSVVRW